MNWHEILASLVSGGALLVLSWWGYSQRGMKTTIHDLEIRIVRVEGRADFAHVSQTEIKVELADIRENMITRDDFTDFREQVCQRIDDLRS